MPFYFLIFSLAWFFVVALVIHRALPRRAASLTMGAFALWLLYASALAHKGMLLSDNPPPRMILLLVPLVLFIVWMSRGKAPLALARNVPLRVLVGLQSFRIGVEIFLDGLWKAGTLPQGMTWSGHNYDIVTGITAALLWLFWDRIPRVTVVSQIWNWLGLALVTQVAVTGVLSVPGPQQLINKETPNIAVVTFPYVLVAALFVVSAVALHILSLRKIGDARNG
jgi:FtsH-binding integral membrane protein